MKERHFLCFSLFSDQNQRNDNFKKLTKIQRNLRNSGIIGVLFEDAVNELRDKNVVSLDEFVVFLVYGKLASFSRRK